MGRTVPACSHSYDLPACSVAMAVAVAVAAAATGTGIGTGYTLTTQQTELAYYNRLTTTTINIYLAGMSYHHQIRSHHRPPSLKGLRPREINSMLPTDFLLQLLLQTSYRPSELEVWSRVARCSHGTCYYTTPLLAMVMLMVLVCWCAVFQSTVVIFVSINPLTAMTKTCSLSH